MKRTIRVKQEPTIHLGPKDQGSFRRIKSDIQSIYPGGSWRNDDLGGFDEVYEFFIPHICLGTDPGQNAKYSIEEYTNLDNIKRPNGFKIGFE